MKQRKKIEWSRLDNASKLFPATSNHKDSKVFRIACELYEPVNARILQKALDAGIKTFPLYQSVLRRGVFWYYLEASDIHPNVEIESTVVCAPLYLRDRRNLLFRVSYYNNRINLEIFHALSDGAGALKFMETLIYHYLTLKSNKFPSEKTQRICGSRSQLMDDSFGRYYSGGDTVKFILEKAKRKREIRAYHIKGSRLDENRIGIIEGSMSAEAVLNEAHKYDTSLTVFITSLFIYSIYKDMHVYRRKQPIVLSIPRNLRQFYASETVRNFFSTMNVGYKFTKSSVRIEDIIQSVSESFREELTEEHLNTQLNRFVSFEKNLFMRVLPLPLKDIILRIAHKIADQGVTAAVSNIGRITLPSELNSHIRQFSIVTSARRPQIIICTFGDRLVVSFSSPIKETEIQRIFFEYLSKKGIPIEISSNL